MYDPRDIVPLQPTVMMREGGMVAWCPHVLTFLTPLPPPTPSPPPLAFIARLS